MPVESNDVSRSHKNGFGMAEAIELGAWHHGCMHAPVVCASADTSMQVYIHWSDVHVCVG